MTPDNVRTMVNRIAGAFPTSDVYRENVIDAWAHDEIISGMTVEQGRVLAKRICSECNYFPKLKEVHVMYNRLFKNSKSGCDLCSDCGWVYPRDENGEKLKRDGYTYVVRCVCQTEPIK